MEMVSEPPARGSRKEEEDKIKLIKKDPPFQMLKGRILFLFHYRYMSDVTVFIP